MKIVNLTPYDINILDVDKVPVVTIKYSTKVARLDSDPEHYPETIGKQIYRDHPIPFFLTKYSIPYLAKIDAKGNELERVQFPQEKDGIIYIVSDIFRSQYDRSDLWQSGELVYDKGKLIGCIGLSQ